MFLYLAQDAVCCIRSYPSKFVKQILMDLAQYLSFEKKIETLFTKSDVFIGRVFRLFFSMIKFKQISYAEQMKRVYDIPLTIT